MAQARGTREQPLNRAGAPAVRHHVVTIRMVLCSAIAGVLLAVLSVPVAMNLSAHVFPFSGGAPFDGRYWLGGPTHHAWIYMRRNPLVTRWETSLVHAGDFDPPPLSEFDRPAVDPRPRYARRDYTGHEQSIVSVASGWPFDAATGRAIMDGSPSSVWNEWLFRVHLGQRFLATPLRPIWAGLLGNTLFYGSITLALLIVLRHARARRRRARGRCIACGYELGTGVATCPECGLPA
jgi:hypothetical protein